jgi:hypothetical protein
MHLHHNYGILPAMEIRSFQKPDEFFDGSWLTDGLFSEALHCNRHSLNSTWASHSTSEVAEEVGFFGNQELRDTLKK